MQLDPLTELRTELLQALDAHRGERPLDLATAQDAAQAAGLPLDWRTALVIGEVLGQRGELGLPRHVVEFCASYAAKRSSDRLLDPYVVNPALLAATAERSHAKRVLGLVANRQVSELARQLEPLGIEWKSGDPNALIRETKETFDLVISAPPIGLRKQGISGDASYDLLIQAAARLADDGEIVFLLSEAFNTSSQARKVREQLAIDDVHLRAIAAVPEGGGSVTRLPLQLTFFSRGPSQDAVFVAQLASKTDVDRLARAFVERLEGSTAESGRSVPAGSYTTWEQLRAREDLDRLLIKTPDPPRALREVATQVRAVELRHDEEFESVANAIYLPEIRGKPTLAPTSEGAQKRRYIEVALAPEKANAEYVALWLDSPVGRLARDSTLVGTTIPRLSVRTLSEMPVVLPSLQQQLEVLEVDSRLRSLAIQSTESRARLWLNPHDARSIGASLPSDSTEQSLDSWFETLPFPLASIAYRYTADATVEDKISRLLHLFEATAELAATLLLSAVKADATLYEAERERLVRVGASGTASLERSSFGTWIQVGRTLAKTVRSLLGDPKTKDGILQLFAVRDEQFAKGLGSKELWQVLDDARNVRNSRAHGGIESAAYRTRMLERLVSLLLELRSAIGSMFNQVDLVQPGEMTYRQGTFSHRARRLTGPNSIFRIRDLDSVIALDQDYLYVVDADGLATSALQVIPFFRLMAAPNTEQNAVYFYNSRDAAGTLHFVSYHFEAHPEEPLHDPSLSALLDELRTRREA